MKSRLVTVLFLLVAVVIGFNAGYVIGQSPAAPFRVFPSSIPLGDNGEAFAPFWEAVDLVQTRFYQQPVDNDILVEGAINGMLAALEDQHTRYLSPADEVAERESFDGEMQGIGAEVSEEDGQIVIISPIDGSPAAAAGLLPGDILLQANGTDLSGMSVMEAAALVRGPQGTEVTLLVERDGETFELVIERDVVQIRSVRGEMLEDNLAYVRLSRFGGQTVTELRETLEELMAQNPAGLILDLRRNPGGGLDTVVDVADEFLPEGIVLTEEFAAEVRQVFDTNEGGLAEDIPLVVLIDEGSASASEVLAGAIQDRERGTLIGQTSYGKGTVQTWQELSNGGGLRLTIARWLTPDNNWVHEQGLSPDYLILLPDIETAEEFEDTQLQGAIDFLLGNPVTVSEPVVEPPVTEEG